MILRNFVVTNGLKRSNGDEAQVGDTVRLYKLDGTDFLGTIQFPIAEVNCRNDRSYVIEYEGDSVRVCDLQDGGVVLDCCGLLDERVTALENGEFKDRLKLMETLGFILPKQPLTENLFNPLNMEWERVSTRSPVTRVIDDDFLFFDERFESTAAPGIWDGNEISFLPNTDIQDGEWHVPSGVLHTTSRQVTGIKAPYISAVLSVVESPGRIGVGFSNGHPGNHQVVLNYHPSNPDQGNADGFYFYFQNAGISFDQINWIALTMDEPFEMAVVVSERSATGFIRKSSDKGWTYLSSINLGSVLDLRDPDNLSDLQPYFLSVNSDAVISRWRAGYNGELAIANHSWIRTTDGTPFVRNGKAYFNASAVGGVPYNGSDAAISIAVSYFVICEYDFASRNFRQIAKIFFDHDGLRWGHNSGCVVFDESKQEFVIFASTWGSFSVENGVRTRLYRTSANILHGVHLLTGVDLPIITPGYAFYDPAAYKDPDTDRWYVALTRSTLPWGEDYFACMFTSDDDLLTLNFSGVDDQTGEGTKILRIGGKLYMISSGTEGTSPDTTSIYRVFDVNLDGTFTYSGQVSTGIHGGYYTPETHPNILIYDGGNGTSRAIMTGFDDQRYLTAGFSEGSFIVHESPIIQVGDEHQWRFPLGLL